MKPIYIKGNQYSRLTVISFVGTRGKSRHAYWLCRCRCGVEKIVRASHLKTGSVTSCGCRAREVSKILLTAYATSPAHKGPGNPQWKGKNAKYGAKHNWLARYFKKKECEQCGATKVLDWALKKGRKYLHKRENFIVLCRSCHLKYDYTPARRGKMCIVLTAARNKRWNA